MVKFGVALMLRAYSVEMNCFRVVKGHSEVSLSRLAVGVVLKAPVAILRQEFCMVFSLSRRVGAFIYVMQP